jgi:hypothetical protein
VPAEILKNPDNSFKTPSETIASCEPAAEYDVPHMISWADTERDLSAWLGNAMQSNALHELYKLEGALKEKGDPVLLDDVTITKGTHTFKFGVYAEHDRVTTGTGFGTTPMGNFSFNVDTNNPNDTRNPFANALIGNFTSYSESTTRTRPAAVSMNVDWYVQDSWRVTRNLTLEIGLRVAYYTPWHYWSGLGTDFAVERFNPARDAGVSSIGVTTLTKPSS